MGNPASKLLFVGDSLTYVNDLDQQVQLFGQFAHQRAHVVVERRVEGGAPLKTLWTKTDAKAMIASGRYDVVVLQEDLPETDLASFHKYARMFHEVISRSGAETVLLAAWPYERLNWIDGAGIIEAHRDAAERLGARVAPVALAWRIAVERRPNCRLLRKDREHPSLRGTYLAAATVFATVWNQSPVGLPHDMGGNVSSEDAEFLQEVAWDAVQQFIES